MRLPFRHHGLRAAGVIAAAAVSLCAATAAIGAPPTQQVPATQTLAVLNHDTEAFRTPSANSGSAGTVNEVRPITGERTVLPVLATTNAHGQQWLQVLLPGRPNSHAGWIEAAAVSLTVTDWQITIDLSTRRVSVFDRGHVVRTFLAVIGKPSTPTPTGRFFVEETVPLGSAVAGAPFALALSARSNALAQFEGGPGQIAVHGTANIGGLPGTAVSHGCVRLPTSAIAWIAGHITSGVPVTIVG
jgi:lipoprotein-anchoring transpeptidase ErfK/SrfK